MVILLQMLWNTPMLTPIKIESQNFVRIENFFEIALFVQKLFWCKGGALATKKKLLC